MINPTYALPHPRSRRNNLDLASGLLGGFAMAPKRKASVAASDGDAQDRRFRDLYAEPPDFRDLGRRDPDFAAVYVLWQAVGMRADGSQDKGPRAGLLRSQVRRATDQDAAQARLWPRDRAPGRQALPARTHPPLPLEDIADQDKVANRHNYILWLKRLLDTSSYSAPGGKLLGLDIGTGASCIYPLLGCTQRPWSFVATGESEPRVRGSL